MDVLISILLLLGVGITVIASIGVLTFPDLYTRMHAATKAGTVGLSFILITVALLFQDTTVISRVLGTIFFIILTAPIAAHSLGKAMMQRGYSMWAPGNKQNRKQMK